MLPQTKLQDSSHYSQHHTEGFQSTGAKCIIIPAGYTWRCAKVLLADNSMLCCWLHISSQGGMFHSSHRNDEENCEFYFSPSLLVGSRVSIFFHLNADTQTGKITAHILSAFLQQEVLTEITKELCQMNPWMNKWMTQRVSNKIRKQGGREEWALKKVYLTVSKYLLLSFSSLAQMHQQTQGGKRESSRSLLGCRRAGRECWLLGSAALFAVRWA